MVFQNYPGAEADTRSAGLEMSESSLTEEGGARTPFSVVALASSSGGVLRFRVVSNRRRYVTQGSPGPATRLVEMVRDLMSCRDGLVGGIGSRQGSLGAVLYRVPEAEKQRERPPYVPPSTGAERRLVKIWSDVLGGGDIGSTDDFFALGGHSLAAVELVSLRRTFLWRSVLEATFLRSSSFTPSAGTCWPIGRLRSLWAGSIPSSGFNRENQRGRMMDAGALRIWPPNTVRPCWGGRSAARSGCWGGRWAG